MRIDTINDWTMENLTNAQAALTKVFTDEFYYNHDLAMQAKEMADTMQVAIDLLAKAEKL
jgi:hypothetical protein